jgi:hypothetical protein
MQIIEQDKIMLKRTPLLALAISGIMAFLTILIFEEKARPFTLPQIILLYIIAFLPSLGIAMLFDPHAIEAKREFLKINFYEEK